MKLNNKYFILIMLLLIIVLNFNYCLSVLELIYRFISLLIIKPDFAVSQLSFDLLDVFFSVIAMLVFIPAAIFSRNSLMTKKVNWLSAIIILLLLAFLFPGMITNESPDFYNNLKRTKLLPPFSTVQKIETLKVSDLKTKEEKFVELKNRTIHSSLSNIKYLSDGEFSEKKKSTKVFILGTDEFGRDIFTRIVYGTRISFITGFLSVIVTLLIGLSIGFIAGFSGGFIDTLLNRLAEMFLSIPMIFLIILFIAFFGSSLLAVIILLGFSGWMSLFKIVRGEIFLIKQKDYFISSKNLGLSKSSLLFREIVPVIAIPIIINLIFQFGNVILAEAALSYLGLTSSNSYPSWGGMIQEGQNYLYLAWWIVLFPGILLLFSLYVVNSLGKILNIYYNPRLQYDK